MANLDKHALNAWLEIQQRVARRMNSLRPRTARGKVIGDEFALSDSTLSAVPASELVATLRRYYEQVKDASADGNPELPYFAVASGRFAQCADVFEWLETSEHQYAGSLFLAKSADQWQRSYVQHVEGHIENVRSWFADVSRHVQAEQPNERAHAAAKAHDGNSLSPQGDNCRLRVERGAADFVWVDQTRYPVSEVLADIVEAGIQAGKGEFFSMRSLAEVDHGSRTLKKAPVEIKQLIETKRANGTRLRNEAWS